MIKRIGSLLAVVALTAKPSAPAAGARTGRAAATVAMALAIITAVIEAKTTSLTK